jgi:hypothetical protein
LEFLIVGIAVSFNLLVIKWKYERHRYGDATLDAICLFIVTSVFSGTYGGAFGASGADGVVEF